MRRSQFNFIKSGVLVSTIALASALSVPAYAAGSNVNGTIKGEISDVSGGGLSDATLTVTNESTGFSREISTGDDGKFQLQLPPGKYKLISSKPGYKSIVIGEVLVQLGSAANLTLNMEESSVVTEEMITYGTAVSMINTATAESALNMTLEEVSRMPVSRDIESVALLAPDTILGDNSFTSTDKDLISFGGASVAENAYYIDGMNVTNFRNGLGGSSVPFEFYEQFQIKSGGYSAEFGRSVGGVLNSVTKSGSNDFHYGVVTYFEPAALSSSSRNTYYADGTLYDYNEKNEFGSTTVDLYASGPIIEDKLFFYVLVEPQSSDSEFNSLDSPERRNLRETADDFWGGKLTWNITDDHILNFTAFSDERERITDTYSYDVDTDTKGDFIGVTRDYRGGKNFILRYDGQVTDNLFISALAGRNKYDLTTVSSTDSTCPIVVDVRTDRPGSARPGCEVNVLVDVGGDEREALRFDVEWTLGDHTIRAGIDNEVNTSEAASTYSGADVYGVEPGGIYYRYETYAVGAQLANGATVPDANGDGTDVETVRLRYIENGGSFETKASAYYLEDQWEINDYFTARIGIRNETFENLNSNGETFIDVDNQWAPRLALTWSPTGTDFSRAYINWGRYHLPIPSNTNVRLSGAELDYQDYYVFDGAWDPVSAAPTSVDANGVPTTTKIGDRLVNADGEIPDTRTVLDLTLDPMYQDELIVGYEQELSENWVGGVRYIKRELSSTIDDILTPCDHYILTNPGTTVVTYDECNDTGDIEEVTYTPEELGFPEAERTYEAVEFTFERLYADNWQFRGSYVWSVNEGNTEGFVKSDIGQDDAGITQDFDIPQLMDGAYGYLPNDRRHKLKLFGSYSITDNLSLGMTYTMQSGRPINAFGVGHPDGTPAYGDTFYLTTDLGDPAVEGDEEYAFIPRGSFGRTDWVHQFNISALYSMKVGSADLELRAEVFNLFDADSTLEVYEFAEESPNVSSPRFGLSQYYQTPRYFRFGASLRF